ncbi:MAG: ABC transporter permease [Epulopiscium sp.]|nr:ABC transporter permease [Candidatus Epulonipiscium sp.]
MKEKSKPKAYSPAHQQYIQKTKQRKRLIWITQWIVCIFFFLLWEIAAQRKWVDPFIFSSPSRVLKTVQEMFKNHTLFLHIGVTLWETIIGFSLGTLLGTGIAILLWSSPFLSDVSEPYLVILNSLPKTALAPILIVWIGNNMSSIIVTALSISIIVTILTVLNGFLEVEEEKIKLIQTFGGTKKHIFSKVILPASIPTIINALKVNVGLCLVGVIIGEFLVSKAGLGYLIVYGSQIFKLDWVMMSILILGIMAALLYQSIVWIEKKFLKWRE